MKGNEINCIYIPVDNENEINLIHDCNENIKGLNEEETELYLNAKKINEK